MARALTAALLAALLVAGGARAAPESRLTLPSGFRIEEFASGFGPTRFMTIDPTGTLLVSTPGRGRVVALPDRNRDGRADTVVTVAEGLELPHGLAFKDGQLYVAETGRVRRFRYDPATLKEELLRAVPDYVIEPARIPDKHARAEEFRRAIQTRERALEFLMKQGEWDFLMVVFSVLDRAQHDYWADMDSTHPRHDPHTPTEFRNFIHEIYERLDGAVGRILERLPAGVRVLVVSDHGFCSELYEVRVNEVLAQAGLLFFKSPATRRQRAQAKALKEKIARRLFPRNFNGNVLDKKVQYGSDFLDEIDFTRTRAYFAQDKGVWVNLAGREPNGRVRESDNATGCTRR